MDMTQMPQGEPQEGAEDPKALLEQAQKLIGQALQAMGGKPAEDPAMAQRKQIAGEVFGGY
jgi:hypothetical protein